LGCLFDLGAVAIDAFWDETRISVEPGSGKVNVQVSGSQAEAVPPSDRNLAFHAARAALELSGVEPSSVDVRIELKKEVPVGKGLGSSAATISAVLPLALCLSRGALSAEELVAAAGRLEGLFSKSPHFDNVAASMLGGLVVLGGLAGSAPSLLKLKWPEQLVFVVAYPEDFGEEPAEGKTGKMRSLLPELVSLREAVEYSSYAVLFFKGLLAKDLEAIGKAVSYGGVVEKARAKLIRGYWELKELCLSKGAYGFNISGAGPAVFALAKEDISLELADAVERFWSSHYSRVAVKVARASERGSLSYFEQHLRASNSMSTTSEKP